jgi:hypothetical protein
MGDVVRVPLVGGIMLVLEDDELVGELIDGDEDGVVVSLGLGLSLWHPSTSGSVAEAVNSSPSLS